MINDKSVYATETSVIRILIADRFEIIRRGVSQEIQSQADMVLVGEAASAYELLQKAEQLRPDIIVLDIHFEDRSGLQVIRELSQMFAKQEKSEVHAPKILILSSHRDRQYVFSCLNAGARGYLLKSDSPGQIVQAVRQLAAGQTALSVPIQTILVDIVSSLNDELSPSETTVLRLLAHGHSNKAIAHQLDIAERTVQSHLNNTYRKLLPVLNRAEAVAWAWINHIE